MSDLQIVKTLIFLFLLFPPMVHTNAMELHNSFTLPDGRTLGYAEYGKPDGYPIFYFHGGQESRLSSIFMDSTAYVLNIRIIAPDRPGIGLSTFQEDRTFSDWGNDIRHLADALVLSEYSVFGLSGGAPHVISALLSDSCRIKKAAVVSGAAPYNYKGSLKGMWLPVKAIHWIANKSDDKQLRKIIQNDFNQLKNKPEKRIKQFQRFLPKPDKDLIKTKPAYGWEFINGSLEGYRQGIDGVVQEWKLYVTDWKMNMENINTPVDLWYGTKDKMAPVQRGYYYNTLLSNSELHVMDDEGHFSLIRNHLTEILSSLR